MDRAHPPRKIKVRKKYELVMTSKYERSIKKRKQAQQSIKNMKQKIQKVRIGPHGPMPPPWGPMCNFRVLFFLHFL